jgi:hypothetical protein
MFFIVAQSWLRGGRVRLMRDKFAWKNGQFLVADAA